MIRTPRAINDPATDWAPGGENYVFLSLGHGTNGQMSYEVKTTTTSNSQLQLTPAGANTATLQIARIGNDILLLRQTAGEDWVVHERYSRPDMPATLQVGLVSYTDWGKASDFDPFTHNGTVLNDSVGSDPTPAEPFNPDLVAAYDYARFARPEVPADLVGVDLVNAATEEQILSFLGDNANQPAAAPDLVSVNVQFANEAGDPLESVTVGDTFFADIFVDDLRMAGTGVFSAFADVTFDNNLASLSGNIVFGSDFPNAQEGNTSVDGLIDELGALSNDMSGDGNPQLLARIPMMATMAGQLTVGTNEAELLPDHEIGLYGFDNPVDAEQVVFGADTVTINEAVNLLPVATDDFASMFHDDGSVSVDVLANDTTEPGETLIIQSVTNDSPDGIFTIADGQIQFTPNAGFLGTAMTSYTIDDGNGGQATAQIEVDVQKQWHLTSSPHDVNDDGHVSPLDALRIINVLLRHGEVDTTTAGPLATEIEFYADTNNDGRISALDALVTINELAIRANRPRSKRRSIQSTRRRTDANATRSRPSRFVLDRQTSLWLVSLCSSCFRFPLRGRKRRRGVQVNSIAFNRLVLSKLFFHFGIQR